MTLKYLSEFILLLWVIFGIGKKITIHWIVLLPLLKESHTSVPLNNTRMPILGITCKYCTANSLVGDHIYDIPIYFRCALGLQLISEWQHANRLKENSDHGKHEQLSTNMQK